MPSYRFLPAVVMNVMMAPFFDRVMAQSISEDIFSYLFGSNIKRKMRRLFQDQFTSTSGKKSDRIPLILDWDANYDDTLALIYLLSNPLFDVKAVTCAGTGFATPSGGPINSQMVLEMFNMGHIPVSYGSSSSLSPITQAPLQWRIELDEFFQSQQLPLPDTPISIYPSDVLIANILKEATTAVAVAVIGPATNLAMVLQKEPELIERISGLFLMGSNHPGENNVHDFQMHFNGVNGGCTEAAGHDIPAMITDVTGELTNIRRGCRGNSMSDSGDTEWNVFLDVFAWHVVSRVAAQATTAPPMYVITTGASEKMPITKEDFVKGTALLSDSKMIQFLSSLANAFLGAGEAKWWDARKYH
jgi:inosine-uridine nucleoside N-ribohydrolase